MLVVRLRHAHAIGILRTPALMPAAEMVGVQDVGAAKGVGQALHPGEEVGRRGADRRRTANTTASGPYRALISSRREAISGLVPGDAHPTGVVLLWGGAYHGVLQAVGEWTISGAAVPLTQIHPLECSGSAVTLVNLPSSMVATTPQRDLHRTVGVHLLDGHETLPPGVSARRNL